MPDKTPSTYEELCKFARQTAMLQSVESLLNWDERTLLPPAAGEYRAEQITYLSGLIHERKTDPRLGRWLDELAESPLAADRHSDSSTTIRQLEREYDKQTKIPRSLVEELSRTAVLGQQAWVEARKNDDFAAFEPLLTKIVRLKREQAEAVGYKECPYDALLDDFEPDESTSNVTRVLAGLRDDLVPLVAAIAESGRRPNGKIVTRHYPRSAQESFGRRVAERIGFDFTAGRLDVTDHPFCSSMGPADCRITTRYDERHFPGAFFGILHEAGHGIYDQGLRRDQFGLPPGAFVSLGIHESQSRMWENLVGRHRAFWQCFYPEAQKAFPEALGDVPLEEFYFAIHDVRPSLIRVEADEATYNLHILIRFELEQALINDDLPVGDLPGAWNEKYRQYLDITPPDHADGVLQDIHWSAALLGYFPTYALGNLYACQFFDQAGKELGRFDEPLARGQFEPLRRWLKTNIHEQGQCHSAAELVQKITGEPLSHKPLIAHLQRTLGPLYGVA